MSSTYSVALLEAGRADGRRQPAVLVVAKMGIILLTPQGEVRCLARPFGKHSVGFRLK